MEERLSGTETMIEKKEIHWLKKVKSKHALPPNIQEIWDTMKTLNLKVIGADEVEESQFKIPNTFSKNHRIIFSNLKFMPI